MNKHVTPPTIREVGLSREALDRSIARAQQWLLQCRAQDGHWCFELEADATIPAEYVLLRLFRGEPRDRVLEGKIAAYLRRTQGAHGGWSLVHAGVVDLSASVKAYFALKAIGDAPDSPHMVRARQVILSRGGAERANVFTRTLLALWRQIPWSGVPAMPVEIMLLPRWFPFHIDKISYWARAVLVPLLVILQARPEPKSGRDISIAELFTHPPDQVRDWAGGAHQREPWVTLFRWIDRVCTPSIPGCRSGRVRTRSNWRRPLPASG